MNYYIAQDGKPNGPYTPNELAQRGITPDTLLWNESMTQWTPAGQIPELAYMFNTSAYSGSTYQTPPPPTSNGGYYQQSSYRSQPMPECPKTWLAQSILATLFCCLPFGVVGIVYAASVSSKYNAGDYEGAYKASQNAGKWTKIAFILGLIGVVFNIIYLILVGTGVLALNLAE